MVDGRMWHGLPIIVLCTDGRMWHGLPNSVLCTDLHNVQISIACTDDLIKACKILLAWE